MEFDMSRKNNFGLSRDNLTMVEINVSDTVKSIFPTLRQHEYFVLSIIIFLLKIFPLIIFPLKRQRDWNNIKIFCLFSKLSLHSWFHEVCTFAHSLIKILPNKNQILHEKNSIDEGQRNKNQFTNFTIICAIYCAKRVYNLFAKIIKNKIITHPISA